MKTVLKSLLVLGVILTAAAVFLLRQRTLADTRAGNETLRQQLEARAARPSPAPMPPALPASQADALTPEEQRELLRLRGQVGPLRRELQELSGGGATTARPKTQGASASTPAPARPVRQPDNNWVVSDSDSPEYAARLSQLAAGERNRFTGDARNLICALAEYARQHEGALPATFSELEPYKYKGELPLAGSFKDRDTLAGTNDFEIVYHDLLNFLTNHQKPTALIRQREAWPTPNGKWARIYGLTDGRIFVVESGDNFRSWETEHLLAAPGIRQ